MAQQSRAKWFCECAAKMEEFGVSCHAELSAQASIQPHFNPTRPPFQPHFNPILTAQAGFLEAVRCNHIKYTKTWRDGAAGVQSATVTLEGIARNTVKQMERFKETPRALEELREVPFNPNLAQFHPKLAPFNPYLAPFDPNLAPLHPNLAPFHPNLAPFHPNSTPI